MSGSHPVYLQMVGPDRITLRWGTEDPDKFIIEYGLSPDNLNLSQLEAAPSTNHRVTLTGLLPDTTYYYRLSRPGQSKKKAEINDFVTAPLTGSTRETRIWLLGDPGKTPDKIRVRDAALNWFDQHPRKNLPDLDLVMSTGDQAYPNCTYEEYVRDFLLPYQEIFKRVPIWPVFGNHDARRWAFYQLFDRPAHAELGGFASGSQSYFSFDYAQTHFIFLDSNDSHIIPGSPMLDWLIQDLARNQQIWTIVMFHHPPYTRGSYDSDKVYSRKHRHSNIRKHLLPILELAQVDVVVSGHSHAYEHSDLIHGHYGLSASFSDSMVVDHGSKSKQGYPVYTKGYQRSQHIGGTLYMVLGSSGQGMSNGRLDHPAMPTATGKSGSVVLDIDDETLHSQFISVNGEVLDEFLIFKPSMQKLVASHQSNPG